MGGNDADRELRERISHLASELAKAQAELRKRRLEREAQELSPEERRRRFRLIRGGGVAALLIALGGWLRQRLRRPEVLAAGSVFLAAAIAIPSLQNGPAPRLKAPVTAAEVPANPGEGMPTTPLLSPVEVDLSTPPLEPGIDDPVSPDPGSTDAVIPDAVIPGSPESPGGESVEDPGDEAPGDDPVPEPPVDDPVEPEPPEVDESLIELCLALEALGRDLGICAAVLQ